MSSDTLRERERPTASVLARQNLCQCWGGSFPLCVPVGRRPLSQCGGWLTLIGRRMCAALRGPISRHTHTHGTLRYLTLLTILQNVKKIMNSLWNKKQFTNFFLVSKEINSDNCKFSRYRATWMRIRGSSGRSGSADDVSVVQCFFTINSSSFFCVCVCGDTFKTDERLNHFPKVNVVDDELTWVDKETCL